MGGGASRHITKTIIQNFKMVECPDAVPLFLAVRRLRQAISALIQQTEKLGKDEKSMKGRVTVRIEQPVSSTVDPLAWLHA
jgi:hypothetical protein